MRRSVSAEALRRQVHALLPRHVVGTALDDADVVSFLDPFPTAQDLDTAVITRHEVTGTPLRPDAKVAYYFSIVPFNWVDSDWTNVYAALAASATPLVFSVGVLPFVPPPDFTQQLLALTTFYGRLAREDTMKGGLYFGERQIPPDAFAVEAEQVFRDLVRRWGQRVFGLRIQLASPDPLPPGLVEAVAAAISPPDASGDTTVDSPRAGASYEVRQAGQAYSAIARWNLETIDFRPIKGRAEIWQRPDPPAPVAGGSCPARRCARCQLCVPPPGRHRRRRARIPRRSRSVRSGRGVHRRRKGAVTLGMLSGTIGRCPYGSRA